MRMTKMPSIDEDKETARRAISLMRQQDCYIERLEGLLGAHNIPF
jgi:hypothetical protein